MAHVKDRKTLEGLKNKLNKCLTLANESVVINSDEVGTYNDIYGRIESIIEDLECL